MFKRVTIVALVVAAFLLLAVPAMAFNGYRGDYTTSRACAQCHNGIAGIPAVYSQWKDTKHGVGEAYLDVYNRLPYGSVCQGCHTSNFAPGKLTPTPTATSNTGAVSWAAAPAPTATGTAFPMDTQSSGDLAWSESSIGCSTCHYGASVADPIFGVDANDSAHNVPYGNMADAQICGACHSRYSYTAQTYSVEPVPYLTVTTPTPGTPVTPNPSATTLIQPQMAIGYPMLGSPTPTPAWNPSLSQYLNVAQPGWTPTPDPSATAFGYYPSPLNTGAPAPGLMMYWKDQAGNDTPWQLVGHDGSAAQYTEWASEGLPFGHADALTALTSQSFWGFLPEATKQQCLECHSADFRIMKEAGKPVTSADVKYGITCVGCHAPHDAGTITGTWDDNFDAQLVNDSQLRGNGSNLCTECHNGEIPAGSTASPGAEVHHPMKEMMDGYGAIDVTSFPSVHKGKCIQCHMAPTSYSRGAVQLGANHTFNIITPKDANDVQPIAIATANATATATPAPGYVVVTKTKTVTQDDMPYSACSTCHNNNQKPTPVPVATVTTAAVPAVSPTAVSLTVVQNVANQGDKGLWLQDTIDQRQEWTKAKIAEIHTELNAGAVRLGYADEATAQAALVAIPEASRSAGETLFLKAFTNVGYVESEGSFGIHNWDYSREIVNVALAQARSVQPVAPRAWIVTLALSKSTITRGQKVFFRGVVQNGWGLAGTGVVQLQRRQAGGTWSTWKTQTLAANGSYSIVLNVNLARGKWTFRSFMPAAGVHNLAGNSRNSTLTIK